MDVPTNVGPPKCSIKLPTASEDKLSQSTVVNVSDGVYERCAALLIPDRDDDEKLPILFNFHGSGGNASFIETHSGQVGNKWGDLAVSGKFTLVGGEAL